MKPNVCLSISILYGMLGYASQVSAQEEQWLRYRSERDSSRIAHPIGSQQLSLSTDSPPGGRLPKFKTDTPLFGRWYTPMVEDGYLWVALDCTGKFRPNNTLYIDTNANGHLDDENAVITSQGNHSSAHFNPAKVMFQTEDGPVTYHLNFRLYEDNGDRQLHAFSGGCYEGYISVAGVKRNCVLIDYNANGTFDDKSL